MDGKCEHWDTDTALQSHTQLTVQKADFRCQVRLSSAETARENPHQSAKEATDAEIATHSKLELL